jgi:F420H2:quinone oxidoreductase
MLRVDNKTLKECCGCTACVISCPFGAVKMSPDALGFKYPVINNDLCTNCGKCFKDCQFVKSYKVFNDFEEPLVYAARFKDEKKLRESQSGGVFSAIAETILARGGVVYGVAYSENYKISHCKITKKEALNSIKGSKYVQSNLDGIFLDVINELKNDKLVLFSGVPCQVENLRKQTERLKRGKLITIDILCHGVGAPKVWEDYLHYLEIKYSSSLQNVNMRNKLLGWKGGIETYTFKNKKRIITESYLYLYFSHYIQRESCFNCPYTNLKRVGDISLGDFWHWEKTLHQEFRDNKGISLVLINSSIGEEIFEEVSDFLEIIPSNTEECMQNVLRKSVEPNIKRNAFLKDYNKKGFKYVAYKYGDMGFIYKTKIFIAKILSMFKQ